jgi:uncharacterized membrane protein YheB (UPF0754 family)
MNWWLLLVPFMAACIGPLIISLVTKLLFTRILPRQQPLLAQKIGKLVSTELFSFDAIAEKMTSPQNIQKIMPVVEQHMDDFLRNRLKVAFPVISMFISDKMINELKQVFMKELETLFPVMIRGYVKNLEQDLNIEQMVAGKIASYPVHTLEATIKQGMRREWRMLNLLAAAIGLAAGLVQLAVVLAVTR